MRSAPVAPPAALLWDSLPCSPNMHPSFASMQCDPPAAKPCMAAPSASESTQQAHGAACQLEGPGRCLPCPAVPCWALTVPGMATARCAADPASREHQPAPWAGRRVERAACCAGQLPARACGRLRGGLHFHHPGPHRRAAPAGCLRLLVGPGALRRASLPEVSAVAGSL